MPLVRFNVRNVYGLGTPDLYATQAKKDDPKAILDGVAVAGLVGVLRQLGDLAEFAADIFHGLQEQVTTTSSRSQKMMARIQIMEEELPRIEKVVFSQTEHIHFAYTSGSCWHPDHQTEENRIVRSYLPPFMMDSYEECRDPPSLHLLDKFDIGGPGACLKRYSDPLFFREKLTSSVRVNTEETHLEKKARRSKRSGVHQNVEVPLPIPRQSDRIPFSSPNSSERSSTGVNISLPRSEIEDGSTSYSSRRTDSIDCVLDMSSCVPHKEEEEHHGLTDSMLKMQSNETIGSVRPQQQKRDVNDMLPLQEDRASTSSSVTWDEKTEILKPPSPPNTIVEDPRQISRAGHAVSYPNELLDEAVKLENADSVPSMYYDNTMLESLSTANISEGEESHSESYKDALNATASDIETDTDAEKQTQIIKEPSCIDLRSQPSPSSDVLKRSPGKITRNTVNTNFDEVTHIADVPRETGGETPSTDPLPSSLYSEKTDSSVCSPKESVPEISCGSEVKLWTNGGLLGLAPSKPPDFNVLDSAKQNSMPFDDHSISSDSTMHGSHHDESVATVPDVSESFQKSGSSSIIQPRYRLVANKYRKRTSLSHEDTPKPYSLHASPRNSSSCSPPLQHMKISFHPKPGSEISNMNLEFQDENKDSIFPSFQLLPEPDINSGSDGDDTFSRSSEYMSDQFLSELNETISEQWECDETPLIEEIEIYDSLRRVSSEESISEVKDDTDDPCKETPLNGEIEVHHSLRRVSSAESVSRSLENEVYADDDSRIPEIRLDHDNPPSIVLKENVLSLPVELPQESLPPPPPLPPQPWNATKPEGDESTLFPPESKVVNQVHNSSNVEDKDDFLNQIRLKSLTLKRTVTARPALRPRPVTDMRVTAIILKANALRQAFMGSDDEDDSDDWSDN